MADEKEYKGLNNTYHTNDETYVDFANRKKTRWEKRFFSEHVNNNLEYITGTVVIADTENGQVTATPMSGNVGTEITVTATASGGYELSTLTANNVNIKDTKKFNLIGGTNNIVATFVASSGE